MPQKCIPPPGYDPSRDSMDAAGQAYELMVHVDTLRKWIKRSGIHPPFHLNIDGSYLFSRKATAAWLAERRCRNLLDAARILREDQKARDARAEEAGDA